MIPTFESATVDHKSRKLLSSHTPHLHRRWQQSPQPSPASLAIPKTPTLKSPPHPPRWTLTPYKQNLSRPNNSRPSANEESVGKSVNSTKIKMPILKQC